MVIKKTSSRADLSNAVTREIGLSKNDSAHLVDRVFELMSKALEDGENVKISSFGVFNLRDKVARIGRNPKTGKEAAILPRRVISFHASSAFRDKIKDGA